VTCSSLVSCHTAVCVLGLHLAVQFVSYLRSESVDQLSSDISLGFVGINIEVALTCGSEYPPLNLAVSEFALKSDQVACVAALNTQSTNDLPLFEYRCPPPIASSSAYSDLFERCRNHIKLVVKRERNLPGPILKQGHEINRLTLKAIARYCVSVPHSNMVSQILSVIRFGSANQAPGCNFGESNDAPRYLQIHGHNTDDN